jgi:uncharacterized protein (DUF58 family)
VRAEQYLAPETLAQLGPFEIGAKLIAEGVMSGMHRSPYQGLAVEFAEHRQYVPGDPVRHIDWKVFGRSDKIYLKRFQQETNLDIHFLVDASRSMAFGTLGTKEGWGGTRTGRAAAWTKFDHATAATAAMSFLALSQRDRVSVSLFGQSVVASTRCSNAQGHWRSVVQCLATNPVDGRADLYAIGAMIYKAVCAVPPFTGKSPVAVLTKHLTETLVLPARALLNAGLQSVFLKKPQMTLSLEVKNLLDVYTQDLDGYPLPSRGVYVTWGWETAPQQGPKHK